jgi:hypothetical protein
MCLTSAGFDKDGLRLSDGNVVVNLITQIHFAGDAEFIERNGNLPPSDKFSLGGASCTREPLMITCKTKNVVFDMKIDARPHEQHGHPEGSLYTVDGEEVDYSDDVDGFTKISEEKILKPIAEVAAKRLTSTQ